MIVETTKECVAFCVRSDEQSKLDERRQWLDAEVEKILKRKRAIEGLEEEVKRREAIVSNKEVMLTEKSELQMKKLRSSQVLTKVWTVLRVFSNHSFPCDKFYVVKVPDCENANETPPNRV